MKNKKKLLCFIIMITMTAAGIISCPGNNNDNDSNNNIKGFSLDALNVPDNLKSIYLSSIPTGSSSRNTAVNSISTLSQVTNTGQSAPVIFSNTAGEKFVLEVKSLEQLGDRCIIAGIDGYYEVTSTGAAGSFSVGPKEYTEITCILIDIKNNKFYDFSEYEYGDDYWNYSGAPRTPRFIEGNNIYTMRNKTVYKIDLSSVQNAVPLNNSVFLPLSTVDGIIFPFTISNNIVVKTSSNGWYCLDIFGVNKPQLFEYPVLKISDFEGYKGSMDSDVFMNIFNIFLDLTGKPFYFTLWGDNNDYISPNVYSESTLINKYLLAEMTINSSGECFLTSIKNGDVLNKDAKGVGRYFYFNSSGVGYADNFHGNFPVERYLCDSAIFMSKDGFIRIKRTTNGMEIESTALSIPDRIIESVAESMLISKDDYLFWIEDNKIKRMRLSSSGSEETIYNNPGIINSFPRESLGYNPNRAALTASGRNIIFYQYASATEIHTYSLDMYNPNAQPVLLSANDADVRSIVELNF